MGWPAFRYRLNVSMRETEVEGVHHSGKSAEKDPKLEDLQRQVDTAREGLELRTAELEAAQARLTELEQRLRLIYQSRPYRFAWRIWRMRARTRASLARLRPRASQEQAGTGAREIQALAPDEVPYAAGYAEVTKQPLSNGQGGQIARAQEARPGFYYGSRGIRETDQEQSGPLRAVLLLGGLTEPQLDSALRALALDGPADGEPLVITDCDALRTLDSAGYLYEYIPPREDWERLGRDGGDYDVFVRRRLALIAGTYGLPGIPSTS
jgi:hypothetical protein